MKVLIIEDDKGIIDAVRAAFEFRWPDASLIEALSGARGLGMAAADQPDLIILDLNLPDMDGLAVLKKIREDSTVPVIILTVRSEDEDVLKCLEAGADDYIVKPFNYLTLLARVKAVLRRTTMIPFKGGHENLVGARLSIDFVNQKVKAHNKAVRLTPVEYRLMATLVLNKGLVVSYETLAHEVWGEEYSGNSGNIRSRMSRLRKKLHDEPPGMIVNKPGRGYVFLA